MSWKKSYQSHVKITGVSGHAFDRLGGRKISTGRVEKMLQSKDVKPGHTPTTRCYDIPGSRMVVDVAVKGEFSAGNSSSTMRKMDSAKG